MKITKTNLEDCFVIEPEIYKDERGSFLESFNQRIFQEKTGLSVHFIQDNQSTSQYGVVRGLHMQKGEYAQAKLVRVVKGSVLDVVVDTRENSATFGESFSCILSEKNNKQLFIPKGFLHGFATLEEDTIFSYKCDNYYNKQSETGVIYNDEFLNINWKLIESDIILSQKDKKLQSFKAFMNRNK